MPTPSKRARRGRTTLAAWLAAATTACGSSGITSSDGSDDQTAALILTTSGGGSLTTTGAVITTVEANAESAPSVWLENRRAISIAIARGGGDWVDDLAAEIELPRGLVPRLGAALKRHRAPLAAALEMEVRIEMWQSLLGNALCCDPWIRPFAHQRFTCPAPGEGVVACVPE